VLFLDRDAELRRLDQLADPRGEGGLAVVYGRRRIGKTRLLLEWTKRHGGVYCVADPSAPEMKRRYLAEALSEALPESYNDRSGGAFDARAAWTRPDFWRFSSR
jgi:hypothetical protein